MHFNDVVALVESMEKSTPVVEPFGRGRIWRNPKGQMHRTDGPAVEYPNGDNSWYLNNELHRAEGPAVIQVGRGYRGWYKHGKRHRLDGPAREWDDGAKQWFINNEQLTEKEFNDYLAKERVLKSGEHGIDLTF